MKKVLKNKKGESLIETVISITLFTIFSATIFGIINSALQFNQTAAEESEYFQEEILPAAEMKAYSDEGGEVQFEIVDPTTGAVVTDAEEGSHSVYTYNNSEDYVAFYPKVNADVE